MSFAQDKITFHTQHVTFTLHIVSFVIYRFLFAETFLFLFCVYNITKKICFFFPSECFSVFVILFLFPADENYTNTNTHTQQLNQGHNVSQFSKRQDGKNTKKYIKPGDNGQC